MSSDNELIQIRDRLLTRQMVIEAGLNYETKTWRVFQYQGALDEVEDLLSFIVSLINEE